MIQSKMKFVAMLVFSLIVHIAAWDTPSAYKQGPPQKVKIADVEVITLQKGRMTTGRRNSPVPQLECMGGCGDWTPDVVQCRNVGTDGADANWKCDAEMPQGYRFGQIQVGCEGYDHPEDPYILPGSCQLMYELKGSQARGGAARPQQQQQQKQYQPQQGSSSDEPLPGWVWGVIVVLIVLVVVYGKKDTAGGARSSGVPVAQAYTVHEDSSGPSGPKPTAQAYPAGSSSGSGIGAGTAFAAGAAAGGAAGFAAGRYTAPGARQRGGGTSGGRGDRGGSSHDRDDNFQQQSGFSGTARR